jgi:ATP-dependent RNA helicase RhlE
MKGLSTAGYTASAIHGNKSQANREKALAGFKAGKILVLVATDIAARGIDVDGVSHVINYDLPHVPESYVHRIGRTARAGAEGVAIAFCACDERSLLKDIERTIRQTIPVVQHALGKSNLPPAEHEAKRPNGRSTKPAGQKKQWNPVGREQHKGNRNHAGGHGTPKRSEGGSNAPKRNNGGKPSWMQEISGAKSDRRPVRMGE